jgi:hypothetical protein
MHRGARTDNPHPALVETVFAGFNVPEADIGCLNYIWLHPNLGLMSGGAWCWRGFVPSQLQADLFDMRDFVPDTAITDGGGDLTDVTLPNGYRYQVLEPLRSIRMTYDDAVRGNAFDVTQIAIMPPAMLPSNRHFDQVMRSSGTLRLRGEEFEVNSYAVRDRSWAKRAPRTPRVRPASTGWSRCSTTTTPSTSPGSRTRRPPTGATRSPRIRPARRR